jgi:dihydrolipoamide dehydrogenase
MGARRRPAVARSHIGSHLRERLPAAGVRVADGRISVDQQQRTSVAGVYAAGDVTGPPWLTNRAVATGTVAAGNALGGAEQVRGDHIPRSVNTRLPISR